MKCPTCHKILNENAASIESNPFYPFCCERCRLIDLGKWLDGEYRISEPLNPEELLQPLDGNRSESDENTAETRKRGK